VFDRKQREIYVDGEVYLEVSRDENCPFVVKTNKISIEVLGTSFNVMAYENDSIRNIVLVSGAVKIHSESGKEDAILAPSEMYLYSNDTRPEIKSVDVENHIAWKSGIYRYESESLDRILKRLSRYYGENILYSPQVAHLKCSGKLDLKDDLQLVLKGISRTAPVFCHYDGEQYTVTNK
jgi:ferric-dicitrate binding protein FerR (iron transport regulator)